MARNNRSKNNNPEGRNQYNSGFMGTAKERPLATAMTAAAAVGAGVFLWSRRNQISEQLSSLSDQIGEWRDSYTTGESMSSEAETGFMAQPRRRSTSRSQAEIAEEALTLKETGKTQAPVA